MPDAAIHVERISKKYKIWTHHPPTNLKERLLLLSPRSRSNTTKPARTEIWALRDVSFDVRRGEIFGVIGPNGAGKSTLLSILARITEPTAGYAEIRGRVSSLLEVGTGFHPELSGRDNIYLNGTFLGMSRAETRAKFDEIVEFSELGDLIDMPVKRYSTGMYMRLAFSVAAHLDPEILLLDEVLSVGDATFQEKSLARIEEITRSGRTVLFVSHDAASVANLCHRALYLEGGSVAFIGSVDDALERYLGKRSALLAGGGSLDDVRRDGTGEARVRALQLRGPDRGRDLYPDEPIRITLEVDSAARLAADGLELELGITSPVNGQLVALAHDLGTSLPGGVLAGRVDVDVTLDELPLKPGTYFLSVAIVRGDHVIDRVLNQVELTLLPTRRSPGLEVGARAGAVLVRHTWSTSSEAGETTSVQDTAVVT